LIKLKASGVVDLELEIVTAVIKYQNKLSLESVVKDFIDNIPKETISQMQGSTLKQKKEYLTFQFTKIVKIAIRTSWAESCLDLGKMALMKGKEPKFFKYPIL
jgi:membrane-bound ClpP family serine protease